MYSSYDFSLANLLIAEDSFSTKALGIVPVFGWISNHFNSGFREDVMRIWKSNTCKQCKPGDFSMEETQKRELLGQLLKEKNISLLTSANKYHSIGIARDLLTIAGCVALIGFGVLTGPYLIGGAFVASFALGLTLMNCKAIQENKEAVRSLNEKTKLDPIYYVPQGSF